GQLVKATKLHELAGAARIAALQELVRGLVAGVLQLDDPDSIDPQTKFVQFGLNSLGALELNNGIQATLGISLHGSVSLDHPTVELLAEFLDRQLDATRNTLGGSA